MATNDTPGDEPPFVWLCHSPLDFERAEALERCLVRAGFTARGPRSLELGVARADAEARALRAARRVVVLACVELLTEDGWPAQEALLRTHPQVVVVHLRPSQLRLEGAAVLDAEDAELEARLVLRLQGAAAPAWGSYAERLRERHGRLTLWNLQDPGAQAARDVPLEALYVPPVLKLAPKDGAKPEELAPEELLTREARCLLIRGEPGLGKSTLLRYLALRALERPGVMPVWVSAAAAARDGELVAHLERELAVVERQGRWLLRDALDSGAALLLVDGLDEVEIEARQALVTALQRLQARYPRVQLMLTTRPEAALQVAGAEVFDLQCFELQRSQVLWERLGEVTAQQRPAFHEQWHGWSGQIQALAAVPLLLGLLRQVATGPQPLRGRVEVYKAVLQLFLKRWSRLRSEQKQPRRSPDVLKHALSRVALAMQEEAAESLPEDGFESRLASALRDEDTARLLDEALELGLLKRESGDHLAFQHATFREYLAALALLTDDGAWRRLLPALRSDPRWREVLYQAVAQRGILEKDAADAERRLRDVLDGPATCVCDVLCGPLCLVAELLHEGVGAPPAVAADVLLRLRESLWLEIPAVDHVLYRLSEDPEQPWDESWLAVDPRGRDGTEAALPRITAWLAARSMRAREICQKKLSSVEKFDKWSQELAALGLARNRDLAPPVLRALAGWHHLQGDRTYFHANPDPNDGLVARRLAAALAETARQRKTSAPWAVALLDELRCQLVSSEPQSRIGAAWLLAEAGLYEKEIVGALWDGSWAGALSPAARERSRMTLAQMAAEWSDCAAALLARWRGLATGTDEIMDWLTPLLLRAGAPRAEVIERLLDVVQGEDDARSQWARQMLTCDSVGAADEQLRQALWVRISRPSERRPSERWRLFQLLPWAPGARSEALRTFLTPDGPLEIRFHAARQVAEFGIHELDELAIRALAASFAMVNTGWALFWVGKITARSPALLATFERLVKDGLAELPSGRRFVAARYLYERSLLSKEEWLALGERELETAEGAYRLRVIGDLAEHVDKERLSLALLPVLEDEALRFGEVSELWWRLRPESEAVFSALLRRLATGAVSPDARFLMLDEIAAMLLWRPELLALLLKGVADEALHLHAAPLLQRMMRLSTEPGDQAVRAGVAQVRETLRTLLGEQPPRLAWIIVQTCGPWDADPSVRQVLLRCLEAEELVEERLHIAMHLKRAFHEDAPLLAVLRTLCRSTDAAERVDAARRLWHEGHLGPEEHALLAAVLPLSEEPQLVLLAAGLLIKDGAEESLTEQAGLALLSCLQRHGDSQVRLYFLGGEFLEQFQLMPSRIAEWAAVLLTMLPAFHARLADALLSWLRPTSGVHWTDSAEQVLRALRVRAEQVAPAVLERLAACKGHADVRFFHLGLDLGVPASQLLPALLVALLRSPHTSLHVYVRATDLADRLHAQLALFGWWWRTQPHEPYSLLDALHEHEGAAAELLTALEAACGQVSNLEDKSRRWVRFLRILLGGATPQDCDLVLVDCRDYYGRQLAGLAAARDGTFRQRLVLAATGPRQEDVERDRLLDILRDAEQRTPSSARAEIHALCSAWLAGDEPALRYWALDALDRLGWIAPGHRQVLLDLLDDPIGPDWYGDEASFRGVCGGLVLKHFPESATALHGPLLAALPGQCAWFSDPPIPALLARAGCPRAPLVTAIRVWFGDVAQGKVRPPPDRSLIRDMLVEHGLFEELAADFGDLVLRRLDGFGKLDLMYLIKEHEIELEPDPRANQYRRNPLGWPDQQRLTHIPALLAGALGRRLGVAEEVVQGLWTAVGQRDEACFSDFQRVVQQAASDPVLRPFAVALVDRWGAD